MKTGVYTSGPQQILQRALDTRQRQRCGVEL